MKERPLTPEAVLELSTRAEDHFFDRKAAGISGQKLQKIVVAFANADGGEVVVGIADNKHEPDPAKRWCGLTTVEDYNGLLQAVHILNPSVDVRYEFLKNTADSTFALQLFVERSADVNRTADGKVYQRFGAQSLPMSGEKITELSFAKGARSYENMKLPELMPEQMVDSQELRRFLDDYSPATDPLAHLIHRIAGIR